ncbi:MAG: hypothetical protein ABIF77_04305 [bacterium]
MSEQMDSLTARLRDCLERLRLMSAESFDAVEVPPSLQAALVGADLLARFGDQAGYPAFSNWLRALRDLLQWFHDNPGSGSPDLENSLALLANYLEFVIKSLDDGEDLQSLVQIDDLGSLQQAFTDSCVDDPDTLPADLSPEPAARRLLLLLSSSMWTGEILAQLGRAGYEVDVCDDVETAVRRFATSPPYLALLTDNIEPSVNLGRLATARDDPGRLDNLVWPPLVLVTSSGQRRLEEIAYRFGALGIWRAPFQARNLKTLLCRGAP